MQYYFAPLEGVTGSEFRRAHHRWFPGWTPTICPFSPPTQDHVFTQRELAMSCRSTTRAFARCLSF